LIRLPERVPVIVKNSIKKALFKGDAGATGILHVRTSFFAATRVPVNLETGSESKLAMTRPL
jgi:hypothetical protein